MELPQTNADEVDEALAVAQNPWFLHTANRPVSEQQLSPRQGMHTHKSYFIFYPNFFHLVNNSQSINLFSLSTIKAKSLESLSCLSVPDRCASRVGTTEVLD